MKSFKKGFYLALFECSWCSQGGNQRKTGTTLGPPLVLLVKTSNIKGVDDFPELCNCYGVRILHNTAKVNKAKYIKKSYER